MGITIDFDLSDVERRCNEADRTLEHGTIHAVAKAAEAGIKAVKAEHPYRDRTHQLTDKARVDGFKVEGKKSHATMHWPKKYASYVDNRPGYNFTDHALDAAERELAEGGDQALRDAGGILGAVSGAATISGWGFWHR
jgi:hypothetical protein